MADPYIRSFHDRLRKVERIQRRGGGFEATGTLGRSYYTAEAATRRSWLRPALLVLGCALLMKALLYMEIGAADYQGRVDNLNSGTQVEKIGAFVLQADGLTVWLAGYLEDVFKNPL